MSDPMHPCRKSSFRLAFWLLVLCCWASPRGMGQCAGIATTAMNAADCAAHALPQDRVLTFDAGHRYTLAELIDIAERNNPRTRIFWERAKQRAEALGVEKSAYYPVLAGIAAFADQRMIDPFPKPLSPRGYTMVEVPFVQPEITLEYLIFDFGKREGKVDEAVAQKIAAGANFIAANQQVAFRAASSYYGLLTAQERLEAAKETLKTAQATQDAAEDRLNNGRATRPDVLNARAETAQSVFDLESADGDEKIARVTLTEAVGAEPSPDILVDGERKRAFTADSDSLCRRPHRPRHCEPAGPASTGGGNSGHRRCDPPGQSGVSAADWADGFGRSNKRLAYDGLRRVRPRKRANVVRRAGHRVAALGWWREEK